MQRSAGAWWVLACVGLGCGAGAANGADSANAQDAAADAPADAALHEMGSPTTARLTLVTLGDSLTEGIGDTEWTDAGVLRGFPDRLRARLEARGADVEFTNLGKSGWTSTDMVKGVDWGDVPLPGQLDAAVALVQAATAGGRQAVASVWIGSNDLFGLYGWCHEPDNSGCEADNLAEYKANLEATVAALQEAGATVILALLDDQSLRPVVADPKFNDVLPGLDDAAARLMSAQVVRYNQVTTQLAASRNAVLVDFFNAGIFDVTSLLDADGVHPNAAGYERITTLWEQALANVLTP